MPKNAYAGFLARAFFDFRADNCADPSQSRFAGFGVHTGSYKRAVLLSSPFRHDHHCELLPKILALLDFAADAFVGERNLRDQNDVGTAGHTRIKSDPAGVTSHDFENHEPVVNFVSIVKT